MNVYTFFPASQARDLWYPKKAFPTSSGLRFTYKMIKRVCKRMLVQQVANKKLWMSRFPILWDSFVRPIPLLFSSLFTHTHKYTHTHIRAHTHGHVQNLVRTYTPQQQQGPCRTSPSASKHPSSLAYLCARISHCQALLCCLCYSPYLSQWYLM